MYVLVAEFKIKPDKVQVFGQLIDRQAKESVHLEPDCHQFDVSQAENDSSRFLLYELYSDKAAFEKHRRMSHTVNFLADVDPMIDERSIRGFNRRA